MILLKRVIINSNDVILCMSNVRGKYVKNPHSLPFSFYFSGSDGVTHGPRVKPMFNPERLRIDLAGTLKLCDDWEYIPGKNDKSISSQEIREMKKFFKRYIVIFCAVWDLQLEDGIADDYFKGIISFEEMIQSIEFYNDFESEISRIHDVESLEAFCRKHNLVNMYGN